MPATLREAIYQAMNERHGYSRHTVTFYRVKRLGGPYGKTETIYTTAQWAATEGRPRVAEIHADGPLGEAKHTLTWLVQATKAERAIVEKCAAQFAEM